MPTEAAQVVASFSPVDWAVVIGYLMVMVGIGVWVSKGQKSTRDYFLGGRNIHWAAVGMAIIATETSAMTFIGIPALAFGAMSRDAAGKIVVGSGSIDFLQIIIGYIIARVIVSIVMVPHYFKGDVYSPYQILMKSFGKGPRYLASAFFLVGGSMGAGVRIYVTAIPVMVVFRVFFPEWGIIHSIALFTLISIVYTHVGGIKAVVWTDVIQFCIFIIGGLFALFYIPSLLDGGWKELWSIGKETGRLTWIRSGFKSLGEFHESGGEGFWGFIWANVKEIFGGRFNIWMGLIGATIGVMCSHGVDQLNVQRILTCRNEKEGAKALIFSAVIIFPLFLMFLLVGVGLYAFYSTNGFNFGVNPWNPLDTNLTPKADYIFPIFIITRVPPVLKGFLIAGILAAAMSSISGALSALGSVSIMDLYKDIDTKRKSYKEYINPMKIIKTLILLNILLLVSISLFKGIYPWEALSMFGNMYMHNFSIIASNTGSILTQITSLTYTLIWPVINILAFFFTQAIYSPRDEKYYMRLSRWAIILVSFVLVLIAYFSQQTPLVFNLAFTLAGLTSGALLGSVLFAIWKKRSYPGPIMAGMVTSFIAMAVIIIVVQKTNIKINWPWFTPIGTAITMIVAYLGSLGVPVPEKDFEDVQSIIKK